MNLFTRLPIVVNDPTLPVIPFADVQPLGDYEDEAYGHWIFGGDAGASLASRVGNKTLTQQGASTYSGNYLSMSNAAGNALVTDIADTANPTDTWCMVIRNAVFSTQRTLWGNEAAEASKGCGLRIGLPSGTLQSRHNTGSNYDSGIDASATGWQFVALSRNQPGGSRIHYVGGKAPVTQAAAVYTPTVAGVPLRFGNGFYTSSTNPAAIDWAEAIVFPFALTAADLDVVYARSKARLAKRGITVL